MAGAYTDFIAVDAQEDNDTAIFHPENAATAFQLARSFIVQVPSFALGTSIFKDIEIKFEVRIYRDGGLQFHSETVYKSRFVGGYGFYTWYPLGAGGAGVTDLKVINGESVQPGLGWQHVDVPRPTPFSGEGYTIFDPIGVFSTQDHLFFADYYSPRWKQTILEGDVLDANDTLSIGNLSEESTYRVSYKYGATPGLWLDKTSIMFFATPRGTTTALDLRLIQDFDKLELSTERSRIAGLSGAAICKTEDNVLWALGAEATIGRLRYTEDDGVEWHRVKVRSVTGEETEVVMFGSGFTNFSSFPAPGGGLYACAQKGTTLWFSHYTEASTEPPTLTEVGPVKGSGTYLVSCGTGRENDSTVRLSKLDHEYVSEDQGKTKEGWKERVLPT